MRFIFLLLIICMASSLKAQQVLTINVTDKESGKPVKAIIRIEALNLNLQTDSLGSVAVHFPRNENYILHIEAKGFENKTVDISIPYSSAFYKIMLEHEGHEEEEHEDHELEEVIVQSTRTSRTIANVPTRVETIEMEEIDEKNNMRPANVAMILHESTGIIVQQTSATSANAGIRIQGLDGRYTQVLKDGFANFGNFASGLSILEIPPLDLKQVEIIKGPASPLFGGGAIAGVINFISRTPREKPEYNFIINQSNIGQSNIGGFASAKKGKAGYTMLALYNRQKAFDVDNDHFTEVPESGEFTVHPKLFLYPAAHTTIAIGNSFTKGRRIGGDVLRIEGKNDDAHKYFEENNTIRNISTFELYTSTPENNQWVIKQSFSVFDRKVEVPDYLFSGYDHNTFTDVSFLKNSSKYSLVLGGNFIYNGFRERSQELAKRNFNTITGGFYAQHTLDVSEKIKIESGIRTDVSNYNNSLYSNTELFVLPRFSVLFNISKNVSSRIGGGMGYKTPTMFTEETETIQYRNINQLNGVNSEKSYGGTADVNFRTYFGNSLAFNFNQMFFYTKINDPVILEGNMNSGYYFINASRPVTSSGFETNARFIYKQDFKLFLGYTFTHAIAEYMQGDKFLTRVPRHKLNSALIYEKHGFLKVGLEGYFTGKQKLANGTEAPAFKELGFMAEKIFPKFSLFINFENFTDTRQSRYKNVVNGLHAEPDFDEIWTHTEGFVFNGGIKLKL